MVWPGVTVIIVLLLRKELKNLFKRFSKAEAKFSLGSLNFEVKAMQEIQRSVRAGFPEELVRKAELEALIDTKIRSVESLIKHRYKGIEARSNPRRECQIKIKITTESGEVFDGETLDISSVGIGFKSIVRFRFHEIVKIAPIDPKEDMSDVLLNEVRIVRIEEAKEGYYYGASVHSDRNCVT